MIGEYVRILTDDGIELQGMFGPTELSPTGALIHIHGLAGNFYENRFIESVWQKVTTAGWSFLTLNNRGHDCMADVIREGMPAPEWIRIGAAYERFAECVYDIEAAVQFVTDRGCGDIVLQGHSTGASKVLYYVDQTKSTRVKGLVLLSPADDLGLQRAELGRDFDNVLARARAMIEEGRGRELMPHDAFEYPISAASYVDMFGPDSRHAMFDLDLIKRARVRELAEPTQPVLVIMGTEHEAVVGDVHDFVAALRTSMSATSSFVARIIQGAGHRYLGYEATLAQFVGDWLGTVSHERRAP